MNETFEEICPYCDTVNEYPVIKGLALLQCEHCGKLIKTCSLCYDDNTSCNDCEIDKQLKQRLNAMKK